MQRGESRATPVQHIPSVILNVCFRDASAPTQCLTRSSPVLRKRICDVIPRRSIANEHMHLRLDLWIVVQSTEWQAVNRLVLCKAA